MSRFTASALDTAANLRHVPYALFIDFAFDTGTVRLCSLVSDYAFGGNTYLGGGRLISIGDMEETEGQSSGMPITVDGVNTTFTAIALGDDYHRRRVTIYLSMIDAQTQALVATPEIMWEGYIENMVLEFDVGVQHVTVLCESEDINLGESIGLLWSDEHQRSRIDSSDAFFNQVSAINDKVVKWGQTYASAGRVMGAGTMRFLGKFLKKYSFGFIK